MGERRVEAQTMKPGDEAPISCKRDKLFKQDQPQCYLRLKYFKDLIILAGDGEESSMKPYGIVLLFAQSFPSLTSTSTVEVGSGRIKIWVLESMPNMDCRYFSVYSFPEYKITTVRS